MTIVIDRRAGIDPRNAASALAPALRRMSAAQLVLVACALERTGASAAVRWP
jgi:hypothetical protein